MSFKTDRIVTEIHSSKDWPRVAVIGAGAVGGYFGGMLARAGAPVTMIGRKAFVEAVNREGLFLDTLTFKGIVQVKASTELGAAGEADVVLFCVKAPDTTFTASALAPFLGPRSIVLSLQNGVDNASKISALTNGSVFPAVVYLAASVPEPGRVKHTGRGDLVIGPDGNETQRAARLFQRAGIPCRISHRVEDDLWEKFVCNCALNAISALCQKTYGEIGEHADAWRLAETGIRETLEIAHALNITPSNMGSAALAAATVLKLTRQIAGAYSSTAQDLNRKKRTEIDSLNGFIARRGLELGIPTPVNQTLHSLIKVIESQWIIGPTG